MELPVAVAADGEEAADVVFFQPGEEGVGLMLEAAKVGMTVFFAGASGPTTGVGEMRNDRMIRHAGRRIFTTTHAQDALHQQTAGGARGGARW